MATIEQPYLGRWCVSDDGGRIGVVNGDFAIGFMARDKDDHVLGHYPTYELAMYALLHKPSADCRPRRRDLASAS
jgi:hypothetical protein